MIQAASSLQDALVRNGTIPQSVADAHIINSPYVTSAEQIEECSLEQISTTRVISCDGDGLVILPNENAKSVNGGTFIRLYGIDAPELDAISYIKVGDRDYTRRNGHMAHLALTFYLQQFRSAMLCKEIPANGVLPIDPYEREIGSYWFKWTQCPKDSEMLVIDKVINLVDTSLEATKDRIMSSQDPRVSTEQHPFLLNLNALLVLGGVALVFTR